MRLPPNDTRPKARRDHLWWFGAALFAPFALALALLWHTGRNEAVRRQTERRVLADYGSVAVAQLARKADSVLHRQLDVAFHALATQGMQRMQAIPAGAEHQFCGEAGPSLLLAAARSDTIPVLRGARTAFRFDIDSQHFDVAGEPFDSVETQAIRARLVAFANETGDREPHRVIMDTLAGKTRFHLLWLSRGPGMRTGAVYGIVAPPTALGEFLKDLVTQHQILPSALLAPPYPSDALYVTLHSATGVALVSDATVVPRSSPGVDMIPAMRGGGVLRVYAGPRLATALQIGRPSPLYVPVLVALLILSILLGVIAFVQLRRVRDMAQLRERFVANVSHELRTPLTQMSMFAEMIATGRTRSEEQQREYAAILHRETRRLTTLVERVLRFSRSQQGHTQLRLERRDLVGEVRDTVELFAPVAAAADMPLQVDAKASADVMVEPDALRQILLNLFDNAVKYGAGRIDVTIDREGNNAVVTVVDRGRGIPAADRERVFEPYTRLDQPGAPSVSGAGIGMSVVKDLVAAHGGRVWIAEGVGRGASITFTIPCAPPIEEIAVAGPTERVVVRT